MRWGANPNFFTTYWYWWGHGKGKIQCHHNLWIYRSRWSNHLIGLWMDLRWMFDNRCYIHLIWSCYCHSFIHVHDIRISKIKHTLHCWKQTCNKRSTNCGFWFLFLYCTSLLSTIEHGTWGKTLFFRNLWAMKNAPLNLIFLNNTLFWGFREFIIGFDWWAPF